MVQVEGAGHVWISPDPESAGRSRVTVTCFDVLREERAVQDIVVTLLSGEGPTRQLLMTRLSPSSFVADVDFRSGANRIVVIARAADGTRLRAVLDLDIPR